MGFNSAFKGLKVYSINVQQALEPWWWCRPFCSTFAPGLSFIPSTVSGTSRE